MISDTGLLFGPPFSKVCHALRFCFQFLIFTKFGISNGSTASHLRRYEKCDLLFYCNINTFYSDARISANR